MKTYQGTEYKGSSPKLHEKTYVADGAKVVGDVTLGEYSSVWYNCTLRGDMDAITVGRYTNIQDNSVIHVAEGDPVVVGDYVSVGHGAILHGCTVEDEVLIGMGAMVLNRAKIGRGSIVAAGAVVLEDQEVPPDSLVVGTPAKVIKKIDRRKNLHAQALSYKDLWTQGYGLLPDADGEHYNGEEVI
ncbi:MAG: gamma carbonic anhydrase family protein [Tissierellia bacterium]|nr:gamma carbonic anhydrase family protein [Tissierellia bacterium]